MYSFRRLVLLSVFLLSFSFAFASETIVIDGVTYVREVQTPAPSPITIDGVTYIPQDVSVQSEDIQKPASDSKTAAHQKRVAFFFGTGFALTLPYEFKGPIGSPRVQTGTGYTVLAGVDYAVTKYYHMSLSYNFIDQFSVLKSPDIYSIPYRASNHTLFIGFDYHIPSPLMIPLVFGINVGYAATRISLGGIYDTSVSSLSEPRKAMGLKLEGGLGKHIFLGVGYSYYFPTYNSGFYPSGLAYFPQTHLFMTTFRYVI